MSDPRYCEVKGTFCYCHDYGMSCEDEDESTPFSRSRAALPENIRKTLEASNLPIEVATAIADLCEIAPEERRNAERYRWLRDNWSSQIGRASVTWHFPLGDAFGEVSEFEKMIDGRMANDQSNAALNEDKGTR